MKWMEAVLALTLAMLLGCVQGRGTESDPPLGKARATLTNEGGKAIFVIATAPPDASLEPAILGEKADYWWVRVAMPQADAGAVDTEGGFSTDLENDTSGVVFAQNYHAAWSPDPTGGPPVTGYVIEEYVAGQEKLSGRLGVSRGADRLSMDYFIQWQGMTDRFPDMGSVWHERVIEGGAAAELEGGK